MNLHYAIILVSTQAKLKSDYPEEPHIQFSSRNKFHDDSSINFTWQVGYEYEIRGKKTNFL